MHPFAMTYAWTQRRAQDDPGSGRPPRRGRARHLAAAAVRALVREGRRALGALPGRRLPSPSHAVQQEPSPDARTAGAVPPPASSPAQ